MTQTYWLERTDRVAVGLRRYVRAEQTGWTCGEGWHDASVYTGTEPAAYDESGYLSHSSATPDESDPRWPTHCSRGCGYEFTPADHYQAWLSQLYRRSDTGELRVLSHPTPEAPAAEPGACWDAWWLPESYQGPDGICLVVRCPGDDDWMVDRQASNCTRKGEPHQCWVRHGDPRECRVTVDKDGETCSAGAGSIQTGSWHGFLRDGQLVV